MSISGELLLENGKYAGGVFGLILVLLLLGTGLFVRGTSLLLRIKVLDSSSDLLSAFRRKSWRVALGFGLLLGLLLAGGVVWASLRQLRFSEWVHSHLSQVQMKDGTAIAVSFAKSLGILVLAFLLSRVIETILASLRARLERTEALSDHRKSLHELLGHLRTTLHAGLLFFALGLSAQLLGVSGFGVKVLTWVAYVSLAIYLGRFLAGTAHLVIDVVFGLTEVLSKLENPLRYLGRLRHLSPLTKRASDYLIYVALATWTVEQIVAGSWAGQTGRLALRVIVIFYLSRVLVEVCLLLMSEFFLTQGSLSPAEYQQRQTLVPVAAGIVRYSVYFAALLMILREAGFDTTPLWAGAGAIGVAIGLGGQSLVGDLVAGFFILFENLFLIGDFIEVGEVKGNVEEIGIRVTKIRDDFGVLHAIPNGEVRKVASHSKGYVNVVIDLPIAHGENLHRVIEVLTRKTAEVRATHSEILGETAFGLEDLREHSLLLRAVTMVKPGLTNEMSDVLRLAFWDALVTAGVSNPYSQHLVLSPTQVKSDLPKLSASVQEHPQRSDIQKIKAHNLYLSLDVDDNGYVEQADLDALALRLIDSQRRERNSVIHTELLTSLKGFWNELVRSIDRNADGRISREEFLQFCQSVARDLSGSAGNSIRSLSNVLFIVCDRNQTGTLSEAEFLQFARAYGLADAVAVAGFALIDRDRNGSITKEEWLRFLQDVFVSQKHSDAAAVVFGPGCREHAS